MTVGRFSVLLLASLALMVTCITVDSTLPVHVEPIPLLAEVEHGKGPVQQSVMLRLHSPDTVTEDSSTYAQDLIVVLDVSGSMRGAKLEKAKAAISSIVSSLRPNDRLHLVSYHSSARVEFTGGTAAEKEALLVKIAALTDRGATNLYAGLEEAESVLDSENNADVSILSRIKHVLGMVSGSNSVKRIFLFSDGLVNTGVTNRQAILQKVESLRERGVTTSAFGIGSDYDQDLMSAIAEVGSGEFFFIQGKDDMEKVVKVATAGFQSLFATEAQVRLTALNNATALHVYGQGSRLDDKEEFAHVSLGDLQGGDVRTILVDLVLPNLSEDTVYLAYELQYLPSGATGEYSKQHGNVSVRVVADGLKAAEPNTGVLLFRNLQQRLMKEEEIEMEIKSGHFDRAADMEDYLESDLRQMAHEACSTPQETAEQAHTCSRSTAAWKRTQKSQETLRSGSMGTEMAAKAYMFKRQMNAKLSASYDEL